MPFVNQRWLGGMLTNFSTVYKRLQRLKELEEIDFNDVAASGMTKKELLQLRREHDKLDKTLGGIRDMARVPSAIWVVDTKKEHIAINEARKLGIPVVAILDTNCDPDEVNYPIPGNDDAIRSVALLTRVVADAVAEGLIARAGASSGDDKPAGAVAIEEPLAEWERELLEGSRPVATAATADAATTDAATADAATTDAATADAATTDAAPADSAAAAGTVTPADSSSVEAAAAEGAADTEINAESAITSDEAAVADQADDQAGIAEATDEASTDETAAPEASTDETPEATAPEATAAE
jgi:small subunit ribosomal protein S2